MIDLLSTTIDRKFYTLEILLMVPYLNPNISTRYNGLDIRTKINMPNLPPTCKLEFH